MFPNNWPNNILINLQSKDEIRLEYKNILENENGFKIRAQEYSSINISALLYCYVYRGSVMSFPSYWIYDTSFDFLKNFCEPLASIINPIWRETNDRFYLSYDYKNVQNTSFNVSIAEFRRSSRHFLTSIHCWRDVIWLFFDCDVTIGKSWYTGVKLYNYIYICSHIVNRLEVAFILL